MLLYAMMRFSFSSRRIVGELAMSAGFALSILFIQFSSPCRGSFHISCLSASLSLPFAMGFGVVCPLDWSHSSISSAHIAWLIGVTCSGDGVHGTSTCMYSLLLGISGGTT